MIRQATIDKLHDMRLGTMADAFTAKHTKDYLLKTALVCWLIKNGTSEKAQNSKRSFVMRNSVIQMPAWRILNTMQTAIWINPR